MVEISWTERFFSTHVARVNSQDVPPYGETSKFNHGELDEGDSEDSIRLQTERNTHMTSFLTWTPCVFYALANAHALLHYKAKTRSYT